VKIATQPAQQYLHRIVDVRADFTELSQRGLAWTAEHDHRILAIAGVEPQWENRATAFALIALMGLAVAFLSGKVQRN